MNWPKLKSKVGHTAVVVALAGGMLGGFGAAAASAQVGTELGDVTLSPSAAGTPTSTTPTYSTSVGCNTGFQGSAVFRIVEPSGSTFSIAGAVNNTASAFSGTLLGPISEIQSLAGVPNGGTAELVVFCFSGDSLTGTSSPEMDIYLHISADGTTYSSDTNSGGTTVPVGEVGGLVFAGLAAIGLVFVTLRRRHHGRTQPSEA